MTQFFETLEGRKVCAKVTRELERIGDALENIGNVVKQDPEAVNRLADILSTPQKPILQTGNEITVRELKKLLSDYSDDAEVIVVNWETGTSSNITVGGDDEDEGTAYCRISIID